MSGLEGLQLALTEEDQGAFDAMRDEVSTPVITDDDDDDDIASKPAEEPEAEEEEKPAEEGKRKTVPHSAFHEERLRRKETEKRLAEASEKLARIDERFRVINELQRPEQPQEQPIDVNKDPIGYMAQEKARLDRLEASLTERAEQERQYNETVVQQQRFVGAYKSQVEEFKAEEPKFQEAYDFLAQSRVQELMAAGYDAQEAVHAVNSDELRIVARAMQRGENPGKVLVNIAKTRGWKPSDDKPAVDNAEKLDKIAEGRRRNVSMSSAAGSSGDAEMTVDKFLSMSDSDAGAWSRKNPAKFAKLLGK